MTNIVFDVGNVLIRWDATLIFRDAFETRDEIDAFLEEIDFHAWNLEQDRGRSYAEGVAEASARHPQHAERIARLDTDWQRSVPGAIEGAVAILERLKAAAAPLYAITNFSAEKWAESRERFDFLATSFRDVVVSAHERLLKPDPAIYRVLLSRNGLEPADCVFIDDSEKNVAGARAVGMDAIRFTDPDALAGALKERGLLS